MVNELRFGDQSSFSIEIQPSDFKGQCHLVFIANGAEIGRRDEYTLLSGCLNWSRDFLAHSGERVATASPSESPAQIMARVYDVLYAKPDSMSWEETGRLRRIHHMDDLGMDSLRDKFSLALVQIGTEADLLLWRVHPSEKVFSALMPFGAVDRALREFVSSDLGA
jgi:hypothetical protein